jgi:hypothetical protein
VSYAAEPRLTANPWNKEKRVWEEERYHNSSELARLDNPLTGTDMIEQRKKTK